MGLLCIAVPPALRRHFLFPAQIYVKPSKAYSMTVALAQRIELEHAASALLRGNHEVAANRVLAWLQSLPETKYDRVLLLRERLCVQLAGWLRKRKPFLPTRPEAAILVSLRHVGPATTVEVASRIRIYCRLRDPDGKGSKKRTAALIYALVSRALVRLKRAGLVNVVGCRWQVTYPGPESVGAVRAYNSHSVRRASRNLSGWPNRKLEHVAGGGEIGDR
jgi:hypothetical protein